MLQEIYFDNSATTRQFDEVTKLMADVARNTYGNPSSLHTKGIEAERLIISARETIANLLGAKPQEIYFTSGGTESNNLAIRGFLDANPRLGKHIITTQIEHPSVLEVYRQLEKQGYDVDYIGVDKEGLLDINQLREKLKSETALISIILVNNETGVIQQIDQIAAVRDDINMKTVIHVDAVQAYGKISIRPEKAGIGLMSVSSHKIHGPKGLGALYVSRGIKLNPLFYGGGQESLLRSGTENVPGIAGFGLASKLTFEQLEDNYAKVVMLKGLFIDRLKSTSLDYHVLSPEGSSAYILSIAFEDVKAEVLLHHLEQKGIYVSTGSACSSRRNSKSHVLTALNLPSGIIDGTIRFSFSIFNTEEEVIKAVHTLDEIIPAIDINRRHKLRRNSNR